MSWITALRRWWLRASVGRDDGVSPRLYRAWASGPGDVEGVWETSSPAEAVAKGTVERVVLRFPFREEWIAELGRFGVLELAVFDCERTERGSAALRALTALLPDHRPFEVWVVNYLGRDKPPIIDQSSDAHRVRWFDCPAITESETLETLGPLGRPF